MIDDGSCCGVKFTTGLTERFVIHSIDEMAGMLPHVASLESISKSSLCGRSYDLKSRHKEFPVSVNDRDLLRFLVLGTRARC